MSAASQRPKRAFLVGKYGTGTGADQDFTVYARVPPQTVPAVGYYTDTVVVTVNF